MNKTERQIAHVDFHFESKVQTIEGLPAFIGVDPMSGEAIDYQAGLDAAKEFEREISELSASLTYAMASGMELSVWGRNLLDDRYIVQVFDSPAQAGSVTGYVNAPRTYGVSARFRW